MKVRYFSITIISLLCCSLCSGGQEKSIGISDPNEPKDIPIGYRAIKEKPGEQFSYIPVYDDGSEGPPRQLTQKKKSVFNPQSYFLATGLKRETLFIGPEIYRFEYEESGIQDTGTFYGITAGYILRNWIPDTGMEKLSDNKKMFSVELRFAGGEVDYDGQLMNGTPYRISNIPDKTFEARFLIGPDLLRKNHLSTFYTGLAYRYLLDDSSSDPAGYERESNYLYLPVGYQFHQITDAPWSLAATIEGDVLLYGVQRSDLGALDVNNEQHTGLGFRTSLKFQNRSKNHIFCIEPFFRYWDIDDSETEKFLREPANETIEFGMQFKWMF
jgi:hypothetical protein